MKEPPRHEEHQAIVFSSTVRGASTPVQCEVKKNRLVLFVSWRFILPPADAQKLTLPPTRIECFATHEDQPRLAQRFPPPAPRRRRDRRCADARRVPDRVDRDASERLRARRGGHEQPGGLFVARGCGAGGERTAGASVSAVERSHAG